MRDTRQIAVLRSLFKTLHPALTSGITSGITSSIKSGLAPAKRMLTGTSEQVSISENPADQPDPQPPRQEAGATTDTVDPSRASSRDPGRAPAASSGREHASPKTRPSLPPLPRTLTDEHLVTEIDNATRQYDLAGTTPEQPARRPARSRRHYNRETLLSLLEEAKVRIQVLETELELARGTEEHIPMLTEEWSDDLPSTYARKPD